jgi:DNA mismatch repair protein MutH
MNQLFKREVGGDEDVERLLSEEELFEAKTFEQQVIERFTPFIGKTANQIAQELSVDLKPKQLDKFAVLARAMMGVKKKKIEEFEAAGVRMKTIQLKSDGTPKEAMSFASFKYREIINEVWDGDEEEGEIRAGLQTQLESRFLFIVYRCQDKCKAEEERVFEKAFFWTMPQADLTEAQSVWKETINLINDGKIVKSIKLNKLGEPIRETYFPASSSNDVAHVRPHGQDSSDIYPLPVPDQVTGEDFYTKHCFWLNIDYIKRIVN